MRKFKDIIGHWENTGESALTARDYTVKLSIHDAARLEALAEMFPSTGLHGIITDLLSAALDEVEASFAYVPGKRVIQEDEFGDPVFEDIGHSRQFHDYVRKHTESLEQETQINSGSSSGM